jgi:hypothetical protein
LKNKIFFVIYITIKNESESRYDLEYIKKTIKATKTQAILDRISYNKKGTDIDFFFIIYIRNRASKFTGSTSKQGNNNNQTQIPLVPRAKTSKTPVNVSQTVLT